MSFEAAMLLIVGLVVIAIGVAAIWPDRSDDGSRVAARPLPLSPSGDEGKAK